MNFFLFIWPLAVNLKVHSMLLSVTDVRGCTLVLLISAYPVMLNSVIA